MTTAITDPAAPGPERSGVADALRHDRRARLAVTGSYMVQGFAFAALLTQVPAIQQKSDSYPPVSRSTSR